MTLAKLADECGTDKGAHQGFMPWYERYLPGPDAPVKLLELGVYQGQSMQLWATHFHNRNARICGLDIDITQCPQLGDPRITLIQADQCDSLTADYFMSNDKFDVLIDDASHYGDKTIHSFRIWWPRVKPGGIYVVEDTHCSYDTGHYGYDHARQPNWPPEYNVTTTMEFLKRLADDVNWDHHGTRRFIPLFEDIAFVHFYPGICFIGKKG